MKTTIEEMIELVNKLNYYTKKYDEGQPEISDKEWDELYFKLLKLEQLDNYNYCINSPTRTINYQVVNNLKKVEHNHKMLSLDKTKNLNDVKNFAKNQLIVAMSKVDGLTCSLKYVNGKLVSAETRGNGYIGEDILHNALTIRSIPHRINYKEELVVDGEIVCLYDDFKKFEKEYKNPRNFAAGSIRLLDSQECSKRNLSFIAWDLIKGFNDCDNFNERLSQLTYLGFFVVPHIITNNSKIDQNLINTIKKVSKEQSIPIDGVVFKFNNITYGNSLGETEHHFKNALAYKFYDETYPTKLLNIEWSMGRTGQICPIAIFEPLNIDGSEVSRASLHNLNIMKELLGEHPFKGQIVYVAKKNQIIPQIIKAKDENGQWI